MSVGLPDAKQKLFEPIDNCVSFLLLLPLGHERVYHISFLHNG